MNGDQVIDPETLEWSAAGFARLPAGQRWTTRLRGVRITLTHGYDSAPVVVEIILAMVARAAASPEAHTRVAMGAVNIGHSLVAPGVSGGLVLMAHEKVGLTPYRLGSVS
nr:hypothetical protein BJQ95_02388 [Cryobacterium sp. SO1]